jgi:uncharacterized surface protein with fasciclin (FAS1) repeats
MKKSILKYFKAFTLIGVMASFIALSSCGSDDGVDVPEATETVWEIIENTESLSLLEAELSAFADLVATLDSDDSNLTIFAPTDAAMNTLLGTLQLDNFSSVNQDIAKAVLAYHVVATSKIASGDVVEGETFTTAQGEVITVGPGGVLTSGATSPSEISNSDIQATNGVVHQVSVVLVPPTIGAQIVATLGTVAQPVLLGKDFTILAGAISKADSDNETDEPTLLSLLSDRELTGEDQITVFAPTNATFDAGGITVDTYNAATWEAILKHHIVSGGGSETEDNIPTLGLDDLTTGASFATNLGLNLVFAVTGTPSEAVAAVNPNAPGIIIDSDGDLTVTDPTTWAAGANAEIVLLDADGGASTNGRVHVIAGVLAPPQ